MKKIILSSVLIVSLFVARAQITQGIGGSLFLVNSDATGSQTSWGITDYFRYHLSSNISVGIPFSFGISGNYNSRGQEGSGISFTLQVPIAADYNFGLGSKEGEDGHFGAYGGVGFGYFGTTYSNTTTDIYGNSNGSTGTVSATGPYLHGGLRFDVSEHILDLGLSYHKGLNDPKASIIGISLLYGL